MQCSRWAETAEADCLPQCERSTVSGTSRKQTCLRPSEHRQKRESEDMGAKINQTEVGCVG